MRIKRNFGRQNKGQGLVEYAFVIALVAVVCIIILGLVGLAVSRNYGLIAGVLGAKKVVDTPQNYVRFDTNPPQCGTVTDTHNGAYGHRLFYAQFNSDFPFATDHNYTVATDIGLVPQIQTNPPLGLTAYTVNNDLTDTPDVPCPNSIVIQLPKSAGGGTVAYTVLHQDWGP